MNIISVVSSLICVMILFAGCFYCFYLGYKEGMETMKRIDDNIIEEAKRQIYGKE